MFDVLLDVCRRVELYQKADIPTDVSERDGMLRRGIPGALEEYLRVGRSAVAVIAQTMVAAGRSRFESVLDLPCGGGRVTRHLAAFLPDALLYVGELDQDLQAFVANTFQATPVNVAPDFSSAPPRQFDLIFVGSLVTHLDRDLFERATRWYIGALAPDGLLILTTHGRRHDVVERTLHHYVAPEDWDGVNAQVAESGFGFVQTEGDRTYGVSMCSPSWLMKLVERERSIRVAGFQEAAWNDHQDVLALRKTSLSSDYPL